MWKVESLTSVDENGNLLVLHKDKLRIYAFPNGKTVVRIFDLKDTPPCLQIAVTDLIKQLSGGDKN